MGGVYGDTLASFPELLSSYTIFSMEKRIGAGLGERKPVFEDVLGYVARTQGGKESTISDLRNENEQAVFYCFDDMPSGSIKQGLYIEDNGELFTFVMSNNLAKEGGFAKHSLQLVSGNTDRQKPHQIVNLGVNEFK